MVGRGAGQRVAPCERRKRFFAAKVADRLVDRGDALARHDVDLAVVIADQPLAFETPAIVAEIFGVGCGIAAEAIAFGEDAFLAAALRRKGRGHAEGQKETGGATAEAGAGKSAGE